MRRARREDAAAETTNAPQPDLRPAPPRRPAPRTDGADAALERGTTVAMLSAIGRIELSLDLLERRLERVEATLADAAPGGLALGAPVDQPEHVADS